VLLANPETGVIVRRVQVTQLKAYEVRQLNSWNGPVKAKFAYLCTSNCCRLRNTLLVKLCTS